MDKNDFFEKGTFDGADLADIAWNPHPVFKGVFMKNIITGESTLGRISCHLVKVEAGCEIGDHIHAGKVELHEVVGGEGYAEIEGRRMTYHPGVLTVIQDDKHHKVVAGNEGLYLFAKFAPALI